MKKILEFLSVLATISSTVCCTTPAVDEPDYSRPEFDYSLLENIPPYNEESAEVLDLPLGLYPNITDQNGDICWQRYELWDSFSPGESRSCLMVTFSLLAKRDSTPDFVNNYVIVRGGAPFISEYGNHCVTGFENNLLHRPDYNSDMATSEEGYCYEFQLPIAFVDCLTEEGLSPHQLARFTFYNIGEGKWYRTKRYKVTFYEDLIEGDSPLLGGKVTMECLE